MTDVVRERIEGWSSCAVGRGLVCAVSASLALVVGCGGGANVDALALAPVYVAAAVGAAAARRAQGQCVVECAHHTHCVVETGLCEPGEQVASVPPAQTSAVMGVPIPAPTRTASATASEPEEPSVRVAYVCRLDGGDQQVVRAVSRHAAREVCLAWNDVAPDGDGCTCERRPPTAP